MQQAPRRSVTPDIDEWDVSEKNPHPDSECEERGEVKRLRDYWPHTQPRHPKHRPLQPHAAPKSER
jgi:hypothetical protein